MSKELILKLTGMNKYFGPTRALNNVDISISRGEIRGLIGENGSGKSTVASIIAGIQPADTGEMLFKGKPYKPCSMIEAQNSGVGMVVQELGTVSGISIAENIFLGREAMFGKFGFVNGRKLIKAAGAALEKIGITDMDSSRSINSLDLQDRKLVEVAKVINDDPEIFILDETTTALSQRGRAIVYDLMKKLKAENRAVLFISHDLEELMEVCDTLTVLRDGKLIANLEKDEFEAGKIKQLMIGRELTGHYYRPDFIGSYSDEVVLKVENLTTARGIHNFSLELHKGEILGIGGLTHCGMHELGKAVFGVERTLTGKVVHNKSGDKIKNPITAMKHKIGYVSKDRDREALVLPASVKDNIVAAGLDKITAKKIFISHKKEKYYTNKQITDLSIKCSSPDQYVQYLSGGNKQKVVFGKWVGRDSEILILDCCTRGVDVGVKASMYKLLHDMKNEGKSIIMISEELPELIGMSDRLIILKDGKQTAEFRRSPDLTEAKIIDFMI